LNSRAVSERTVYLLGRERTNRLSSTVGLPYVLLLVPVTVLVPGTFILLHHRTYFLQVSTYVPSLLINKYVNTYKNGQSAWSASTVTVRVVYLVPVLTNSYLLTTVLTSNYVSTRYRYVRKQAV
jgi:hypothetical protein